MFDFRGPLAILVVLGAIGISIFKLSQGKDSEIPQYLAVALGMVVSHYFTSKGEDERKPKAGYGQEMETRTTIRPCPAAMAGIERANYDREAGIPAKVEVVNEPLKVETTK